MGRSPLGTYAELVAALVAVVTIAAAIGSRVFDFQDPFLDSLAALSIGAIFGSTATANGVKAGQVEVVQKLDAAAEIARAAAPTAETAAAIVETAENTEEIVENTRPGGEYTATTHKTP